MKTKYIVSKVPGTVLRLKKKQSFIRGDNMEEEYDLSKFESRKNLYAKALKKQVTLRVRPDVIDYFKNMSEESGIPYQTLINLYLQDCVKEDRKLNMTWAS